MNSKFMRFFKELIPSNIKNGYPSQKFSDKTGITPLHKKYKLPFGLNEQQIRDLTFHAMISCEKNSAWRERWLGADWVKAVKKTKWSRNDFSYIKQVLCREIIRLNPELVYYSFHHLSRKYKFDLIQGVVSRFLPEDISYYIHRRERMENPNCVEDRVGSKILIEWRTSKSTLELIKKHRKVVEFCTLDDYVTI